MTAEPVPAPLVTIVTPNLNGGRFLEHAIESVAAQRYGAIEHLVVDGGSTDASHAILRRHEGRIAWWVEPGSGQAAAIASGFRRGRGEVLAWLNADDLYLPDAVGTAVRALQRRPEAAMVYGDADFVDAEGRFLRPCAHVEAFSYHRLLHHLDFIVQPAAFFRRATYEAVGGLDEGLTYAMDYDLWLKLGARYPVLRLPEKLAQYRLHGGGKTETAGFERLAEVAAVVRRHGRRRLPSNFAIEKAALHWREARRGGGWRARLRTAATLLAAPDALGELASPRFWRIWRAGRTAGAA